MTNLSKDILSLVTQTTTRLSALTMPQWQFRPGPGKWSALEIIGHLSDSAQNNLQRLVRAQYEPCPRIVYDQDHWVRIQRYQEYAPDDLLLFWQMLNRHFCHLLDHLSASELDHTTDWGKESPEVQTLQVVAGDYLRHMKYHLEQLETLLMVGF